MAVPNLSEIITTTIQSRRRKLADNVTKNTALWYRLNEKGNVSPVGGGDVILEELEFAENGNFAWFSGYDLLPVSAQEVFSAAQFPWKSAACAVLISGEERRKNSGRERQIDLVTARYKNAERTMVNQLSAGAYSDGTGFGGKQIGGLQLLVPADPTTGIVGGIDRSQWTFWRSKVQAAAGYDKTTIVHYMNLLWVQQIRGSDYPDLWLADNNMYLAYLESQQAQMRFTNTKLADAGFQNVKFNSADVVLDGAIGGSCPANSMFALNTNYIFLRPHKEMNMDALDPESRSPINQDATAKIVGWMGNMTMSNASLQGFLKGF